ncbi:MAG: hypothetical protein E5Y62_32470 [Mesorhizobium sp.]|nr:MAG: hypothetical protein EOR03_30625 [Mesorhizobium sp.]TIM04311.1 MAG: hypothetical protein E5Y62_32470 [Mesorhizobium sp.]
MRCRTFDRRGTAPPSVLPDISPQGGRSAFITDFANHQPCKRTLAAKLLISPLVGEMPSFGKEGKTEGGAKDRYGALLF